MNRSNLFFPLVVVASGLFIVTVLAMMASMHSAPESPLPRLVERFGPSLILWEVTAILGFALLALVIDRIQILRRAANRESATTGDETPAMADDN